MTPKAASYHKNYNFIPPQKKYRNFIKNYGVGTPAADWLFTILIPRREHKNCSKNLKIFPVVALGITQTHMKLFGCIMFLCIEN